MSKLPPRLLNATSRPLSIESFFRTSEVAPAAGERMLLGYPLPPWQREEKWSLEQKIKFIEGVFLGLGTGTFVINGMEFQDDGLAPFAGWLLDGQQRLSAIRDFYAGLFPVFGDTYWSDIPLVEQRRRFLYVIFPCSEMSYTDDEDLLKEVYRRLNFSGTPHTLEDLDALGDFPRPAGC